MLHTRFANGSGSARRRTRNTVREAARAALETLENRVLLSTTIISPAPPDGSGQGFGNLSPIVGDPVGRNQSDQWTFAQTPGASDLGAPRFDPNDVGDRNDLQITTGNISEGTAAWYDTAVPFQNFTAHFTYTASNGTSPPADGFTFGFQNDPRSTSATQGLSTVVGGTGGSLGYSGIADSWSVQFNIYNGSKIGSGSNGTVSDNTGTGALQLCNQVTGSGNPIDVTVAYNSTKHSVSLLLKDMSANTTYQQTFTNVNLESILNGGTGSTSTAFMGFTGGTGGAYAYQDITDFTFQTSPTPPPPVGGITGFGQLPAPGQNPAPFQFNGSSPPTISTDDNTLTLTTAATNQTSSAFYSAQSLYQNFTADFTYTESGGTSTPGDGFALVLEDDPRGAGALGTGGASLGYGGITNSVAVEFNMNGTSQVGLGINGAAPTGTNAFVSTTPNVNLASGDAIGVHVNFSASAFVVTLTDTVTSQTFTTTFHNINVPATLTSNQAFVGFTGSTGSGDAMQTISGFAFSPNNAQLPKALTQPATGAMVSGFSGSQTNGITFNRADGNQLNGTATSNFTPTNLPSASADGNTLTLTGNSFNESSSAFFNTPVPVQNFTASFTYQFSGGTSTPGNGFAFVLESDQRNTNAIGGGGPVLGYGSDGNDPAASISSSFGAGFNIITPSQTSASQIGAGNGGFGLPFILNNTGPVNLASGHAINVTLTYDQPRSMVYETLTDNSTQATITVGYDINIAGATGASAFLGFTGSTAPENSAIQTITGFTYSSSATAPPLPQSLPNAPTPASSVSNFGNFRFNDSNAGINVPTTSSDKNTLTITTQNGSEANTAFNNTPVTYANGFNASFQYKDVNGGTPADGFTFTLQNASMLGGGGGSIGYGATIPDSFAVAFNIYNNSQSGIGTQGRVIHNQTTGNVNLRSADPVNINLSYDPQALTLTETLTDTVNSNTYTTTYNNIDLSRILRNSPSAYLGFTGGTGGANATQTITNFTYTTTSATHAPATPQANLGGDLYQYGIGIDGQSMVGGGLDGTNGLSDTFFTDDGGATYTKKVTLNGATQTFNFGAPVSGSTSTSNGNSMSGTGQVLNLPQGKYGDISWLGMGVNGTQTNQKFTLVFTDGTTQTFTQTLSDWFGGPAAGEQIAIPMNYRLNGSGAPINQGANIKVFEYNFQISAANQNKTVSSLVMPNNGNVKMLAMNLVAVPTVTAVTPNTGPQNGGNTVTITGSGFDTATGVKFGTVAATSFTYNPTDGTITATVPAGTAAGPVDVTVTNIAGTSATSAADQYTYAVPPPAITGVVVNGDNPSGLFNAPGQPANGVQRSNVEDIVYTFNVPVVINDANAAFTVAVAGPGGGTAPSTLFAAAVPGSNGTQWAVSLTGQAVGTFGSIANGEYSITINPNAVFAADGVTPSGITGRTDTFYRLFGDLGGNRVVNAQDVGKMKTALSTYNPALDANWDGTDSALDVGRLKPSLAISYANDGFTTTI